MKYLKSRLNRVTGNAAISSVARRLGFRSNYRLQIPRLTRRARSDSRSRSVWFICPDYQLPSGGVRKLYRCVDILNSAGLDAAIVHSRSGFRCGWFDNETRVVSARDAWLGSSDVLVIPEIYGRSICDLPTGVRQVIFNQNVYNTMDQITESPIHALPYTANPDLAFVLVVSQDNAEVLESTFPGIPVQRLRLGIDPALFHLPSTRKLRRIAYMPRKRRGDARDVIQHLKDARALEGWEIVAIDGESESETARLLRSSKLFLSFSKREGFGLPPLEALACGCIVVGYHGSGGREYFHPPFATAVEDGNVAAFATAVQAVLCNIDENPAFADAMASTASRFAAEHYTLEEEQRNLIDLFAHLLR